MKKSLEWEKKLPNNESGTPNVKQTKTKFKMGPKKRWTYELLTLNVFKDLFNIVLKFCVNIFSTVEMKIRF